MTQPNAPKCWLRTPNLSEGEQSIDSEGLSRPQFRGGAFQADGFLENDGGGDKIEAIGPVALVLVRAVTDFPKPMEVTRRVIFGPIDS